MSNNAHKDPFEAKAFTTNVSQKGANTSINGNCFNGKDPFGSVSGVPVQQKKQANINDLWGGFSQNSQKAQNGHQNGNNNSMDFFNSFGGSKQT